MANPPDPESSLDDAVRAYLQREEAGQRPNREEWLAQHPDLASGLTEFFSDHATVENLTAPLRALVQGPGPAATVGFGDGAAAPAPLAAFGDFEDLVEIGRGAMGVVYRARQTSLKRSVALKMILSGDFAGAKERVRFRGEAESVAALQHANIVQIHGFGEHEGRPYFSMEFLGGRSLRDRLDGTPWEGSRAASCVQVLANAIHCAHEHNIVHRDLKPGNVLLSEDGVLKISDFGLALRLDEAAQTSAIVGTPAYMAPEQASASGEVGPAADIYALGAILYELLTGRPPFTATNRLDVLLQVVSADPVSPRQLNPKLDRDLETICLMCLRKDPKRRYASARALSDDLGRYLRGEPILARPLGRVELAWRWCRRHPSRAMAIGIALVAVTTLLLSFYIFNRKLKREHAELQKALTRQVAERLDKQLHELAGLPDTIAAGLALRSDWSEEQLEAWMKQLLEQESRGFGITVAFEPAEKELALYVYRDLKDGRLGVKKLTPDKYKPHYTKWSWYSRPVKEGRASWSEPFHDEGGGDDWTVTYSVPFRRAGKVRGVVTIDLQSDFFAKLRSSLDKTEGDLKGYGFLITKQGVLLCHQNEEWRMPKKLHEIAGFDAEAFGPLFEAAREQKSGALRAVDPHTRRSSTFHFAPVAAAEWLFVAVIEE